MEAWVNKRKKERLEYKQEAAKPLSRLRQLADAYDSVETALLRAPFHEIGHFQFLLGVRASLAARIHYHLLRFKNGQPVRDAQQTSDAENMALVPGYTTSPTAKEQGQQNWLKSLPQSDARRLFIKQD